MYPLTVIRIARGHEVKIEMKSGSVYTGTLYKCDLWMNIHMKNAVKNASEEIEECYIKGSAIKTVHCKKKHLSMQEILQKRKTK
ncbi:U6 snRNA-associated Sm-like protein LSm4 [Nematocida sp. ERTm5]|nr:U6 snRNA-associated Sm-like protein LSm4 [Nematocida sp. AWRm79]KAI5183528.1 U6 snRNA-associated Sm-like protein LSm4 [Nematocida sp. AWRm78]OAG32680.1 U6 snRNA-associated Sm-like protein LSm4 [Nematocida sp. ERTm5]